MKNIYHIIAAYIGQVLSFVLFVAEAWSKNDRIFLFFAYLLLFLLLSWVAKYYVINDIKENAVFNKVFWLKSVEFLGIVSIPVYLIRRKYLIKNNFK